MIITRSALAQFREVADLHNVNMYLHRDCSATNVLILLLNICTCVFVLIANVQLFQFKLKYIESAIYCKHSGVRQVCKILTTCVWK